MTITRCAGIVAAAAFCCAAVGQVEYWSSSRNLAGPHQINLFDGPVFITSVEQAPVAQTSSWGYRDGASDRSGDMYFGWEAGVRRHDTSTGHLDPDFAIDGSAPGGIGTWRALAFDPTGDSGRGSLWVASFAAGLSEVDLLGKLLVSFPNGGWSLSGLAYDDDDGNLWGHTTDGEVIKLDVTRGTIIPGEGWPSGFVPPSGAGLSGLHDGSGFVGAMGGSPMQVGIYNTDGAFVFGPWDLPDSGHLGLALVVGGGGGLAVQFDCPSGGGTATLTAEGGTPGGRVGVVYGLRAGAFRIPPHWPCAGTVLHVQLPFGPGAPLLGHFDNHGAFDAMANVSGGVCHDLQLEVVDLTTCETAQP